LNHFGRHLPGDPRIRIDLADMLNDMSGRYFRCDSPEASVDSCLSLAWIFVQIHGIVHYSTVRGKCKLGCRRICPGLRRLPGWYTWSDFYAMLAYDVTCCRFTRTPLLVGCVEFLLCPTLFTSRHHRSVPVPNWRVPQLLSGRKVELETQSQDPASTVDRPTGGVIDSL